MTPHRLRQRSFLPSFLVTGLLVAVACTAGAAPTPEADGGTSAKLVYLEGYAAAKNLPSFIAGRGISEAPNAGLTVADGEVVWESVREQTDDLGMRHVFYRQALFPSPAMAKRLGETYRGGGIRIEGAELGIHSDEMGIFLVYGHVHPGFALAAQPLVVRAEDAFALVQASLGERKGFAGRQWLKWDPALIAALQERTMLTLASDEAGSFRLVWTVMTVDASGAGYEVRLDAATGDVLDIARQAKSDNCRPNLSSNEVTAKVAPQNPAIGDRTVWARQADQRLPSWSHEGGRKGTSTIPPIEMFFRTYPNPTPGQPNPYLPYACKVGAETRLHGVLPLMTSGAYPWYSDGTVLLPNQGAAAGDALYFTYKTMHTLKSTFSWCGHDGSCSERANILLDHDSSSVFLGYANWEWGGPYAIPDGRSVVVYLPAAGTYAGSAAMDVIAHEWGHAVVDGSANFPYNPARNQVGDQLDEGFADVLGHSVEWLNQPPGAGAEQADWMFGEDRGPGQPYWRRVYPVDLAHEMKYHKDHDPLENDAYKRGNVLPTVLYMLSEGAQNPLVDAGMCNPTAMPGCDTYVEELGVEMASKVLMRTLTKPLILSTLPVVMLAGSMSLVDITDAQGGHYGGWLARWHVFTPWGLAGLLLFTVAATAESNRAPFDLPEGESEIIAGHLVEYSGFKYALFFIGEYLGMFAVSALGITLFLGGWRAPVLWLEWVPSYMWFFLKLGGFVALFIWLRGTLPRLRADHLMNLAWKFLLPLVLLNAMSAALWHYTAQWTFAGAGLARWLLCASLVGVPYVVLGRRLFAGQHIGPRTYRMAA